MISIEAAEIIMNDKNLIETKYGVKSVLGIRAIIEEVSNSRFRELVKKLGGVLDETVDNL